MKKSIAALSAALLMAGCSSGRSSTSDGDYSSYLTAPSTSLDLDYVPVSMFKLFEENDLFTTFAELVKLTDLAPLFEPEGEITVFLPANAAFDRLPEGTVAKLKDPKNKEILTRLLSYHILDGKVPEMEVAAGTMVMKSGDSVQVEVGKLVGYLANIKMNGVVVIVGDIWAGKSVAHLLADVLIPPGMDLSTL